jgi:hypothetical protein
LTESYQGEIIGLLGKWGQAKTFLEGSKEYAGAGFDGLRAVLGHF